MCWGIFPYFNIFIKNSWNCLDKDFGEDGIVESNTSLSVVFESCVNVETVDIVDNELGGKENALSLSVIICVTVDLH